MDLDSARGAKQDILSYLDQLRVPVRGEVRFGQRIERPPEVAVGFAPTGRRGDFHVAVRAESEAELPPSMVEEIRRRAKREVNIRYTGVIKPLGAAGVIAPVTRPLAIGASIAHYRCGAGTLGFFARRSSDGVIGLVSNNHVIAASDQGNDRDEILQPAPDDKGTRSRDVVALLSDKYPRLRHAGSLDCAFARLVRGMQFNPAPAGQKLAPMLANTTGELVQVCKIGRTTGKTYGNVTAFELDQVRVRYPFGLIAFNSQIEIDSIDGKSFSLPGDSGSLVFTYPFRQPLGMIFGCSLRGGTSGLGLTFANPIRSILTALGVTLIT